REHLADGTVGGWVSSRDEDEKIRERWHQS
ncbi:molybdopterin synthase catalytic subunit, partial [Brucella oryzae]